jgi:hypothetical protein
VLATPLEGYANPSTEWKQGASRAAPALQEAEHVLPPTAAPSSSLPPTRQVRRAASGGRAQGASAGGQHGGAKEAVRGLGPSPRVAPILERLRRFMDTHVYPAGGPALPCPALPCPALPCPALPCPALPCPALPCPGMQVGNSRQRPGGPHLGHAHHKPLHSPAKCHSSAHHPSTMKCGELSTHVSLNVALCDAEAELNAHSMGERRWTVCPLQEELKERAKAEGLWNLWIPAGACGGCGGWGGGSTATSPHTPFLNSHMYIHAHIHVRTYPPPPPHPTPAPCRPCTHPPRVPHRHLRPPPPRGSRPRRPRPHQPRVLALR